jgi:cysteinyl-tRNA synthetase
MESEEIKNIVEKIINYRKEKKYKEADILRQKILDAGYYFQIKREVIKVFKYFPMESYSFTF